MLMALSFMPLFPTCPSTPNGTLLWMEPAGPAVAVCYFTKHVHMSQISTSLQLYFKGQFMVSFLWPHKKKNTHKFQYFLCSCSNKSKYTVSNFVSGNGSYNNTKMLFPTDFKFCCFFVSFEQSRYFKKLTF